MTINSIFPPPDIQTVFCDGVANAAHSKEFVKFYLSRFDSAQNSSDVQTVICAQIVMPLTAFMHTVVFFQSKLDELVRSGLVYKKDIDDARAVLGMNS